MTDAPTSPSLPDDLEYLPTFSERIGSIVGGVLEFVGVKRKRNPDGTLAPRRTKRLAGIVGTVVVAWLLSTMVAIVPAGSVGVPVTLGNARGGLGEGFHITWPFTTVKNISIRTTAYTMAATSGIGDGGAKDDSVQVLGADGASGGVDSTVLFRVGPGEAENVYVNIGTDYVKTLIRPSARNCIRSVFTTLSMVDAATTGWSGIEDSVTRCMHDKLDGRGIELQDFQLREVRLEDTLQDAVTRKTAAEQDAERQRFELDIAEARAEITRVDAKATADAQQILACGGVASDAVNDDGITFTQVVPNSIDECSQAQLTPAYLQWSYIQALQALVDSPNNSTIILPFDQGLTPLLNLDANGNPVAPTGPPSDTPDESATTPPPATPADAPPQG